MEQPKNTTSFRSPIIWAVALFLVIILVAAFSPLEQTLGESARIVYLHGAQVWAAILTITASGLVGLAGLLLRRQGLHLWSRAAGRAGLLLYVTYLPMSLYLMQISWNGLFFDEPSWRIPFTYAVVGLLLQAGLFFMEPIWASLVNPVYAAALLYAMRGMANVLHPDSPIAQSGSVPIQVFFAFLLALMLLLAWQISRLFLQYNRQRTSAHP